MIVLKMVGLCLLLFGGIKQQIYQLFLIVPLGGVTYKHTQLCNHHCPPSPELLSHKTNSRPIKHQLSSPLATIILLLKN